jgi:hypothetical protein
VRQARHELVALLRESDSDGADRVERAVAERAAVPSVVVVGETKRGKSSLVNALLAQPGLSPVDAGEATATYLVFGYAEQWRATACYPGTLPPVPFDLAELPNWVSAAHDLPPGQLPPGHVEIGAPVPILRHMSIVDTPGVGGLTSMHGELAKQAAAGATALLFTVDASSPLTAGELAFLREVGERVETVVFACTKTDIFRGWRQVLADNRALLATHAPRFADAPWYPCSPRLFELANGNAAAAAVLREQSGIAPLQTAVQELVVGRSVMLAEANGLRALDTALAGLIARLRARCRTLSAGADEAAALRARRDELTTARRSSTRGWQVRLRGEIQRARVESAHDVQRQMRDAQSWFRQAIDAADRGTLPGLPAQVDAALQLVSGRLSTELAARMDRVAGASMADLFTVDELAALRAQLDRPMVTPRPPERRAPTAEDKLLVFMGVSGGFGAARVAALPLAGLGVAALTPFVLPATIVIGLGAGWWLARTRKHTADKQHMKQWLTEAIADARATMDQLVAEQLIDVEQRLSLALDDALARRIDAIDAELHEVDRTMKLADGERTRELAATGRGLTAAQAGQQRVAELLAEIRVLRDRA